MVIFIGKEIGKFLGKLVIFIGKEISICDSLHLEIPYQNPSGNQVAILWVLFYNVHFHIKYCVKLNKYRYYNVDI